MRLNVSLFVSDRQRARAGRRSVRVERVLGLALGAVMLTLAMLPAQSVTNPRTVTFTASADHNAAGRDGLALVVSYDLELFQPGISQPVLVLDLGRPSPNADGTIAVDFAALLSEPPLPGQQLVARVVAVGPGGRGESALSNPFEFRGDFAPGPPRQMTALRITQPPDGATLKLGEKTTIASTVTGDVIGVDFYVDGRPVGTASKSPYQISWVSTAAGRHAITAVTVNGNGVQAVSSPVLVMVSRVIVRPRTRPPGAPVIGHAKPKIGG